MLKRLVRLWRSQSIADAAAETVAIATPTLDGDVRAAGVTLGEWQRSRRERPAAYVEMTASDFAAIRDRDTARGQSMIAAAERILRHEFNLLGSGPYVPRDPERPDRDGYSPIDWYWDPVRQLRFPPRIPYKQWNLLEMRPGNADVKYPWELGRCQHWVVLGQAFRLSGDERYARGNCARTRRLRRSQSDWSRHQLDVHDGRRLARGQLGDRARSDSPVHCTRRRVLGAGVQRAIRSRGIHSQQPRKHLRSHQQSFPQQPARSPVHRRGVR